MKTRRSIALAIVASVFAVTPARAATGDAMIVAGAGSYQAGYVTQYAVAQLGEPVMFVNADVLPFHTVVAEDFGSDDEVWCGPLDPAKPENPVSNPRAFPLGRCPLFYADLTPAAAVYLDRDPPVVGSAPVLGVEHLEAQVYEFYCRVHADVMTGALFVLDPDEGA